jgi:hypothetical protein
MKTVTCMIQSIAMKNLRILTLLGLLVTAGSVVSQDPNTFAISVAGIGESEPPPATNFVRFDLSFPGGAPAKLIQTIQDTTKRPLNVIVPEEHADVALPELKLKGVTVPQLFDALGQASRKVVHYRGGNPNLYGGPPQFQSTTTSYGFRTKGQATPDSVWYFYLEAPVEPPLQPPPPVPEPPKICRFYQLAPYLDELKVEDITTALETAWKMLGEKSTPDLKFHKDTQLLIAVGPPDKLALIESVLAQLRTTPAPYGNLSPRQVGRISAGPMPGPGAAPIAPLKPRPARSEPGTPQPAQP